MIKYLFKTPVKVIQMENHSELTESIFKEIKPTTSASNWTDKKELQDIFNNEASKFFNELTGLELPFLHSSSWINSAPKYDYTNVHHHGNSFLVGVYYLRAKKDCGDLILHDPRGAKNWIAGVETRKGFPMSGRDFYSYEPKEGELILFPAYISHNVNPNFSDDVRVSLAINFWSKEYKY
jgi:uncharacterized protein (TIGR02466 family)